MAANNRRTSRSRYNSRGSMDGNLARKLNRQPNTRELERQLDRSGRMDFDQLYERQPETAAERNARRRAQVKASVRAKQSLPLAAMLGFGLVAAMTVLLLQCYVWMNAISRNVVSMKSEIEQLRVEQVALLTEYEQTFDLSAVKEAAEAAGMTQPSDGQVYYVVLPGEDQATAHQVEGGVLDRFFTALGRGMPGGG